ncbi:O-antigen ligase family protein [Anaerolineales bacterium HSG6]|nr:O-antigen ligase family protein [Anaerolineales bacterium HSG6]MDM8530659.1 O-antigen ligase family protein [Anaerolineales bacterium HSG25]
MENIAFIKLRDWITADDPRVAGLGIMLVIIATGGTVGLLFGGLGPIIAIGLLAALTLGVLMLQSTQVGLFVLVGLICLLPYGALPFKVGFRPTFLDFVLLALFGVWGLRLLTGQQRRFVMSPIGGWVLAFLGWAGFTFIFGLRYGGLNMTITRNFLEIMLSVGLFFMVVNQVRTNAQLEQVSRAIILAGGLTSTLGIFFYVIPGELTIRLLSLLRVFQYPTDNILRFIEDDPEQPMRAIATSIDPNALGGLMVFLTIITFAHLFATQPIMPRPYLIIIAVLMALTLYLTFSRGALLGVVAGLGAMSLLRYRKLIIVMIVVAALMLILPQTQFYVTRFIEGIQGQDLATQMRFGEYKDAFDLISRYPFTGVGFFGTPDIDIYVGVSSVYLLLAQQMGIIGAGLYIIIGVSYLIIMLKTIQQVPIDHPLQTPLLAYGFAILGAMVGGVFDHFYFNLTFIHVAAIYWLTMGLGMTTVVLWREELATKDQ